MIPRSQQPNQEFPCYLKIIWQCPLFPKNKCSCSLKPLGGGQQIIHQRQKIADRCKDGWQVVEEYESDELASNSVDVNKFANAEKSIWESIQSIVWLGLRWNSDNGTICIEERRLNKIFDHIQSIRKNGCQVHRNGSSTLRWTAVQENWSRTQAGQGGYSKIIVFQCFFSLDEQNFNTSNQRMIYAVISPPNSIFLLTMQLSSLWFNFAVTMRVSSIQRKTKYSTFMFAIWHAS